MVKQLLLYQGKSDKAQLIEQWKIPKFPITGSDLKKSGVKPGPSFGKLMNSLKEHWIESDFTLTKKYYLKNLRDLKTINHNNFLEIKRLERLEKAPLNHVFYP